MTPSLLLSVQNIFRNLNKICAEVTHATERLFDAGDDVRKTLEQEQERKDAIHSFRVSEVPVERQPLAPPTIPQFHIVGGHRPPLQFGMSAMLESFAMLTFLVAALVAISAMGREATHPVVLFLYRSLLFAIALWYARDLHKNRSFSVSPGFLGLGTLACLLMMSFLRNPSTFEGFYLWYQFVLFAVMFVLLAAQMRSQSFD